MRKLWTLGIGVVAAACCVAGAVGCDSSPEKEAQTGVPTEIVNGGFESADLSGWTVEYGTAFSDDSVSSQKTFEYADDEKHNQIPVNATGNWYLSGKGFEGKFSVARTGAIRSSTFRLTGDGVLSMKLAGGAPVEERGGKLVKKPTETVCYVGVYRASDDRLIARQTNEYFVKHTESYVIVSKYESDVYNTDNFYRYELDLSEYLGEDLYLRVVDNDQSNYYGYISVDDIRTNGDAEAQTEGAFFTKTRSYVQDAEAPENELPNGGFETGSLAGWTIVSGEAFSHEGVNAESVWWNENITYSRDGDYHYGFYNPTAVGVMRSSEFVLGGSGYISYKLGGCKDNAKTYLRFLLKTEEGDREILRASNYKFRDFQFPYVANGMRLLNMVQYYADFSAYLGQTLYIEAVDENASADDLGCMTLDSIQTYWQGTPSWSDFRAAYEVKFDAETEIVSPCQVLNGNFETGDLTGWTASWTDENDRIGYVSSESVWWGTFSYNKGGNYLFTGISDEGKTGTLTSSEFEVGGCGWMTFRLGGGGDPAKCYVSVLDAETGEELARYANAYFFDPGFTDLVNRGTNLANMVHYRADLSAFVGRTVRLQIVDNATGGWGLVCADSFRTYYQTEAALPDGTYLARNILPRETLGEGSEYQALNGNFETGDLTGWTATGDAFIGISHEEVWWNEWYSFNKEGEYFLSGWAGNESATGTLTSSEFTVGGCGWITFRLGGGKDTSLCNVSIVDAETGETLAIYGNTLFRDLIKPGCYYYGGKPIDLSKDGSYLANMALYRADLSAFAGRRVKIVLTDRATEDWGLLFADEFITYYATEAEIPVGATVAIDLK